MNRSLSQRQRRIAVTFMDQVVSSVSNFATGLAIARFSGAAAFGRYMLVATVWVVAIGLHRSIVSDPVIVTTRETDDYRPVFAQGASAEFLLGGAFSILLLVGGLACLAGGLKVGVPMVAVAPWLIPLLLQDYWRAMSFQQRRPGLALANDLAFAGIQVLAIVVFAVIGWRSTGYMVSAWGAGALTGAVLGFRWFPGLGRLRQGWQLVARFWPLSRWILADYLTSFGSNQAFLTFAYLLLSQERYGGLQAAFNLMGPVIVIVHAGANVGLPEASRLAATDPAGLRRFARNLSLATSGCVALYGAVVAVFGRRLLLEVYGPQFPRFAPLATLAAVEALLMCSVFGQGIALKAAGHMRRLWSGRIVVTIASVASLIVLVHWLGTTGAAWAGAATGGFFAVAVYAIYRYETGPAMAVRGADVPDAVKVTGAE